MNDLTQVLVPIEDRAMLAYLSVGGWSARKMDKKASKAVVDDNKASVDAARVNKNLLASADSLLTSIRKKGDDARKFLEANTLPWDDAGNRLLPNAKSLEVIAMITSMEQEYNDAVDEFVQQYPVLRAQALISLGDLANDDDYPQPDVVRHKFYFRVSLSPMASGFTDARVGLNDAQAAALQKHFEARTSEQFRRALDVAWKRLRDTLSHISDRLAPNEQDPDKRKIFRDSMLDNARETCALLKDLNVFGDVELETVRRSVENMVESVDANTLRNTPSVATAVKQTADELLERMKAWA